MSNSGHHDSSTHLHLSYKIHSSKDFSCSVKFTTEKHWCPLSNFSYFHRKAFLGKPATITFDENKDVSWSNSDCRMTILLRQPWEELVPWEQTPWHWSKHVKFRPSWLFRKGVLLCTADKLQCWPMLARNGTYWCMLAFSFLHLSFIIFIRTIASVVLSSSVIWK